MILELISDIVANDDFSAIILQDIPNEKIAHYIQYYSIPETCIDKLKNCKKVKIFIDPRNLYPDELYYVIIGIEIGGKKYIVRD